MVDVFRRVRDGIRTALAVLRESNSDEPDLRDVSVVLDMDIGADDPPTAPASAPASPVATRGAKRLAPEAPPQSAREETPERAAAPGSAAASAGEGGSQSSSSPAFSRTVRPRRTASPRRSPYAARGASRANDDSYQVDPDPERLARLLEDTLSPDVQSELCLPDADRVVASARPPLSELVMRAYVPTDLQMLVCEALCRNASRTHAGAAGSTGSLTLRTLVADASVVAPEHQPVWGRSHGKYQWIDHRPLYAEARSRRSNPSPRSASPRDEESDTDSESGESEVVVGPDDFHGSMYTEALARLIMASSRCMSQLTVRVPPGVGSMVLLPPAIGACAFLAHLCLDGVADVHLMFPLIARATRLRHLEIRNSFAVHQDAHVSLAAVGMSVRASVGALFQTSCIEHLDYSSDRSHTSGAVWSAAMTLALADPALHLPALKLRCFVVDSNMHDSLDLAVSMDPSESSSSSSSSSAPAATTEDASASIVRILARNSATLRRLVWLSHIEPPAAVFRAVPGLESLSASVHRHGFRTSTMTNVARSCPALEEVALRAFSASGAVHASGCVASSAWASFAARLVHLELTADAIALSGMSVDAYVATAVDLCALLRVLRVPLMIDTRTALSRASLTSLRRLTLDTLVPTLPLVSVAASLAVYTRVATPSPPSEDESDGEQHARDEAAARARRATGIYNTCVARRAEAVRNAIAGVEGACAYAAARDTADSRVDIVVMVCGTRVIPPELDTGLLAARQTWGRLSLRCDHDRWIAPPV